MKMVIYKANGIYCVTTEENYNARIQNARAIHQMQDFNSAKEVIEYFCNHFGSKAEDFTIIKHLKAYEINGENGVFVKTGNNTYSFEGNVETDIDDFGRCYIKYRFIIEDVADYHNAIDAAMDYCCGYLDRKSVRNIKQEEGI